MTLDSETALIMDCLMMAAERLKVDPEAEDLDPAVSLYAERLFARYVRRYGKNGLRYKGRLDRVLDVLGRQARIDKQPETILKGEMTSEPL